MEGACKPVQYGSVFDAIGGIAAKLKCQSRRLSKRRPPQTADSRGTYLHLLITIAVEPSQLSGVIGNCAIGFVDETG
jgi:hypothetical protein